MLILDATGSMPSGIGMGGAAGNGRARSCFVFSGYVAALLLALWALFVDFVSVSTGDYTTACLVACASAVVSLVLVVGLWRGIPIGGRLVAVLIGIADLWTLFDAGSRRLLLVSLLG